MPKILIVDDRPDVRLALSMLMEDEGHEIVEAEDGHGVIELVRGERPDLMLLDLMMPIVDGFEVLRLLKNEPELAGLPVIVVSAKPSPEDRSLTIELGAVDYVTKPWSIDDLIARVNRAVEAGAAKRRHA